MTLGTNTAPDACQPGHRPFGMRLNNAALPGLVGGTSCVFKSQNAPLALFLPPLSNCDTEMRPTACTLDKAFPTGTLSCSVPLFSPWFGPSFSPSFGAIQAWSRRDSRPCSF
jgi:hypothetical protein